MITISQIKLSPSHGQEELKEAVRKTLRLQKDEAFAFDILRQSVDARRKPELFYVYTVCVSLADEKRERQILKKNRNRNVVQTHPVLYRYGRHAEGSTCAPALHAGEPAGRPVIVGTGPAGLFCGLLLAREGMRPILIERGDRADTRARAVQSFWSGQELDSESNVQFGEGGAGTFSDGKLNTGIRDPEGRIRFILQTFADAGADPEILYSYKPHVGTDVLRNVVTRITDEIMERGGTVLFRTRLDRIEEEENGVWKLSCTASRGQTAEGACAKERVTLFASQVVLAIGHSARDTFSMLKESGFSMSPKAFAVGLRIQHPQGLIDSAMYGEGWAGSMPPSPYKLTHRLGDGRGVYSFCMCPGGYVVNASSETGMTAVNGMSYHDRSSGMANSAIVVTVSPEDIISYQKSGTGTLHPGKGSIQASEPDVLCGMEFQRMLERSAYRAGGGAVPLQRFADFCRHEEGTAAFAFEPKVKGTWTRADLRTLLPENICAGIEEGILAWERQISGFSSPEAILAGTESRTSSPVRIERGDDLQAHGRPGIYPCGEGAGYAGGITSAAADGLKVAEAILRTRKRIG